MMSEERPKQVVVIDDDQGVLESFQFMLELAGFDVAAYPSAKSYLLDGLVGPCCIILDQHMPEMTGLELAATLRAGGSNVPILLITGVPSLDLEARAAACGVERVLAKPPAEDEIIAFVENCRLT